MKLLRAAKGSVSILLCLILLPMVTYSTMIVDATRLQTSRSTIANAGDLALNAALSEYEQTLEDMYGLFAVSKSADELKEHLETYFTETLENKILTGKEDIDTSQLANSLVDAIFNDTTPEDAIDLINLQAEDFNYSTVEGSSLANQAIMKQQIIEYMKYKGPVSLFNTIFTKLDFLEESSKQTDVVNKKVKYTVALGGIQEACDNAWIEIEGEKQSDGTRHNGYKELAQNYNDTYGNESDIENMIKSSKNNYKYMSRCILIDKNLKNHNIVENWDSIKSRVDASIYDDISYINSTDISSFSLGDFSGHFESIMNMFRSYFKAASFSYTTLDNVKNGYSLDVDMEENDTTADYVKSHLLNDLNSINLDDSDPETLLDNLQKYMEKQNESFDFYNDNKSNFERLAAAYKYIETLRNAYDSAFDKYSQLFDENYDSGDEDDPKSGLQDAKDNKDGEYYKFKYYKNVIDEVENKFSGLYNDCMNSFFNHINNTSIYMEKAENFAASASGELKEYKKSLDRFVAKCNAVGEKLERIEVAISEAETKKGEWSASVDALSDGATKSTMQNDLTTTTNGLEKEDVTKLKELVKSFSETFSERSSSVANIKFLDISVVDSPVADAFKDNSVYSGDATQENAEKIANDNFNRGTLGTVGRLKAEAIDGKDEWSEGKTGDNREKFYYTLKSVCDTKEDEITTEQQNQIDNINDISKVDGDGSPNSTKIPKESEPETGGGGTEGEKLAVTGEDIGDIYNGIAQESKVEKKSEENENKVSGSNIETDSDDFSDKANDATNSLDSAQKILSGLSNLAENIRDGVYLEEYFTEMFTCNTDNVIAKKDTSKPLTFLNGYSIDLSGAENTKQINTATDWYGKEVEYIMWGNDDLNKNVVYTDSWIYAVRFALNVIYAFTAADIQSFALEVATAIAGWTVVGVPVVQACITVALALAESAYDIYLLHQGMDVPIYKNASTFVCSPTGVLREAAERVVETTIDKAVDKIQNSINEKIDKIAEKAYTGIDEAMIDVDELLNDYLNKQTESILSSVNDMFVTPIINSVSSVVAGAQENLDKALDDAFDSAWTTIGTNIDNLPEGIVRDIAKSAYNNEDGSLAKVKNNIKDEIREYYKKVLNEGSSAVTSLTDLLASKEVVNGKIVGIIPRELDIYRTKISTAIKGETQKIRDGAKSLGDKGVSNLKSFLNKELGNLSSSLSANIVPAVGDAVENLNKDFKADKSTSGGMTLNYKEYCKIIILVKLISGDEKLMLNRVATLIEANVRTAKEGSNNNFHIVDAKTLVSVDATVKMGTLFPWLVEIEDDEGVDGSVDVDFDFKNLGDYYVNIKYKAVNGY